jgi:PAS domain S-box-containing protein
MHGQINKNAVVLRIERLKQRLLGSVARQSQSRFETPRLPEPPSSVHLEQPPDAFIDTAAAFHALVEGIREGAAILSVDRTVLTCNRRLAEMLKLECEQVMGRSMLEFIPLEDQPPFQALLQSAPEDFKRLNLRLSGGNAFPLPVELVITSLTVRGARVYSLLATDLSRRRRAEEQLTFQAHLLANVSDAIVAMDEHFRITYWNSAAERLYGWMAAEVLGRTASEVIHPELSPEQRRELNERLAETGAFDNQSWHRRRDGGPIWMEARRIALRGPDGRMLGYVSVNRDMTERRRAEEALARQAALLDLTHDAIFVRDFEGVITFWNRGAEELYGWTKDQALGQVAPVLLQTAFPMSLPEIVAEVIRTGRWEGELVRTTREGRRMTVSSRWALQQDAEGRPVGILETNNDITERKRAEQALQALNAELEQRVVERTAELERSNRRVTEILESIQDGFFAVDREWNFTYVNQRAASIAGLAPEELVGQNLWEKFPALLGTLLERQYRTAMAERAPARFEVEGVLTGTNYDVRVNPSADGISVYSIDITERKRVEAERERLLAENQSRRAELDTIVTSIADGLVIYDPNGKIIFTNGAAERLLGYSAADNLPTIEERTAIAKPESEEGRPLEPDQVPSARALRGETLRGVVLRLQRARWVRVSAAPLYDSAGNLQGAVSTLTDFTERKQAEERIHQLNRDLEQRAVELELANKELESFSYSVSHDLQTPLSSVSNFSQLLLQEQGLQLPAESLPYVQHIHDNALAMEQLIQGLLTFSRTTRQPVQKRTVSHSDLVRQVWEEFIAARAGRQVELVIGELPDAQADPLLLKQVWGNLMSNAIKFTRRREVARIEIGSYRQGDRTVCFIRDNGAGFGMADADKLFGVFQRLHSEEEYEGTGLGLAIVARIVHRHGGRVWAEARVNEGATFYFTLNPAALGDPEGSVPGILSAPR